MKEILNEIIKTLKEIIKLFFTEIIFWIRGYKNGKGL
jgi:hypothetical protein